MSEWYTYPNRLLCSVLDELRTMADNLESEQAKRHMSSLVEEAQTLANRMESGLEDWSDVREGWSRRKDLKIEIKQLNIDKDVLEEIDKELAEKIAEDEKPEDY